MVSFVGPSVGVEIPGNSLEKRKEKMSSLFDLVLSSGLLVMHPLVMGPSVGVTI